MTLHLVCNYLVNLIEINSYACGGSALSKLGLSLSAGLTDK